MAASKKEQISKKDVPKTARTAHFENWTTEQVTQWLKEEDIS